MSIKFALAAYGWCDQWYHPPIYDQLICIRALSKQDLFWLASAPTGLSSRCTLTVIYAWMLVYWVPTSVSSCQCGILHPFQMDSRARTWTASICCSHLRFKICNTLCSKDFLKICQHLCLSQCAVPYLSQYLPSCALVTFCRHTRPIEDINFWFLSSFSDIF